MSEQNEQSPESHPHAGSAGRGELPENAGFEHDGSALGATGALPEAIGELPPLPPRIQAQGGSVSTRRALAGLAPGLLDAEALVAASKDARGLSPARATSPRAGNSSQPGGSASATASALPPGKNTLPVGQRNSSSTNKEPLGETDTEAVRTPRSSVTRKALTALAGSRSGKRANGPTVVELIEVSKTYPSGLAPALEDVSLSISAGEFVFVVGTSGSGKSTLLRLLLREEEVSSGTILVAGHDLARIPERKVPLLRRQIGCVFQDYRLLPSRDVAGNVAFALEVLGADPRYVRESVPQLLDLVGLAGKGEKLPHQLSGGEQQRVAIARALAAHPPLLIADEPTGNLDPVNSVEIMKLLDRINRLGTTVIMATHDSGIVDTMRRRVVELAGGQLIRDADRATYGAMAGR